MEYIFLAGAAICFFFHLVCETISSFVKYNFAGFGWHMRGVSLANIFAIASRGFVAMYGLVIALVIERQYNLGMEYVFMLSIALLLGAVVSFMFSRVSLSDEFFSNNIAFWRRVCFEPRSVFSGKYYPVQARIRGLLALLLGVQFVAIVIAYGLCFRLPQHRLFIISFVPVISMLGTLITVVLVEPRLARMIDKIANSGYAISQEFMRARAVSFAFSCALLLSTPIFFGK